MKKIINILYLEDEKDLRSIVTRKLERNDFIVTQVDSMATAKIEISKKSFDLLIIDLNLPDGNGEELIDAIHVNPTHLNHKTKILISSAHLDQLATDKLNHPSIKIISKPFGGQELIDAITNF